jgi:hypothetical protein
MLVLAAQYVIFSVPACFYLPCCPCFMHDWDLWC